jgi:hypothetical protein
MLLAVLVTVGTLEGCTVDPAEPCPVGYEREGDTLCALPSTVAGLEDLAWGVESEDCEAFIAAPIDVGCTSTYEGDIRFSTHEEMVEFCDNFDCIAGGIDIGGDEILLQPLSYGISDLSGLSCLRSSRYIYIGQNADLTLIELPELRHLGGGLSIINNPTLESIDVPMVVRGGGDLSIQYNDRLSDVTLDRMLWLDTFFFIVSNPSLPPAVGHGVRDGLCHVGATTSILWNGSGAALRGGVGRSTEVGGDGVGTLVVEVLNDGEGDEVVGSFQEPNADLGPSDATVRFTVRGLTPRDDPYWVRAWLDDDESGYQGGPTPGDLLSSSAVPVSITSEDSFVVDLTLDSVQ